jgi:hypothetical protein
VQAGIYITDELCVYGEKMGGFSSLQTYSQFATFGLLLFVVVVIFYAMYKTRTLYRSVEKEYHDLQSRVKEYHRDDYVSDTLSSPKNAVQKKSIAAYYHLAVHCDEIYHSANGEGMSDDARIRCELIQNRTCEAKCLLVTVRGTKTLEDILWDTNIFGISPGDDLRDNEMNLLTELVNTFGEPTDTGKPGERLTELLTWRTPDEDVTPNVLQVSHGVWTLAKRVLAHLSAFSKARTEVDFSKIQIMLAGHSLGGGAAFLATLVLSCIKPTATRIACVTFGQPRVLLTPLARRPEPPLEKWQIQKRSIMRYLSTALSNNGVYYHRVVTDEDPIALVPTRVPRARNSSGEKFVHVPQAIVIKEDDGNVEISREWSTSSVKNSHAVALSFLRGVATFLLHRSHKMKSYIRLLDILVGDGTFTSHRHDTDSVPWLDIFEVTSVLSQDKPACYSYKF